MKTENKKTQLSKYGYEIEGNISQATWFIRREEDGFSFIKYYKGIPYGKTKIEKCVALQYRKDGENKTEALYLQYTLKELEDIVKYAKKIKRW